MDRNAVERAYKGTGDAMGSVGIPMPGQDALRAVCGFTRKALPGAAASMAPGSSLEAEKGGGSCQAIPDPEPTPPCLVRALSGRTLVCSLRVGYTLDDVERCVSERTGLPQHAVYLTFHGMLLSQEILGKRTCLVWFRWSRMAGLSVGPRRTDASDAAARHQSHSSGAGLTFGREVTYPGRALKPKAALVNPTVRTPRIVPPKKQSSPGSSAPTLVPHGS